MFTGIVEDGQMPGPLPRRYKKGQSDVYRDH